ncbi:hypothetical protein ALP39_04871 [Pseudomonas marginalis pv. marginalis]|nr:hypothetical protein ALP39_04871 [Pseudomonas marginalis pv. marginalis]
MGLDRLGLRRHATQFAAQAFDMAVDIALVAGIRRYAHRIEQLLAAEHPLGLLKQTLQQAEFMAREAQGLAAIVDLHAFQVYLEHRRCNAGADPLEDRLDPRRHFPRAERLDHIVVRADFQPHHPVDLAIARAEEHHRHFGETAQLLAGFKTADVGQADVEDDQVGWALALMGQCLLAEAQPGGGETLALQGEYQRVGYRRFVFDNQDVGHVGPSAVRFVGSVPTGRVYRCAKFTQGLGADQQRVVETAAVGEVDLDGALDVAQAHFQVDHRALGHAGFVLVVVFVGAALDLADARDFVFVDFVGSVLAAEAEAHPIVAITGEGLDVAGRQRGGQRAGVHLGLEGFADLRQLDVFVATVKGRLGGHDRQRNEGKQGKDRFHVGGFLELSRRILDRKSDC